MVQRFETSTGGYALYKNPHPTCRILSVNYGTNQKNPADKVLVPAGRSMMFENQEEEEE